MDECFDHWLQEVCDGVKRNDAAIDEVEIDHSGELHTFDATDMRLLKDAMEGNRFVTSFVFRYITIDKKTAELLTTMLASSTNAITNLHMEEIQGGEGTNAAALALTLNPESSIKSLCLIGNSIDEANSKAIGMMLKSNRALSELRLSQNSIGDDCISHISSGLKSNRTLTILDLEGNALTDASVSMICNALGHNDKLEFLSLDFNDFGTFGTRAIASMLRRNNYLKELHLFGNRIDSVGAAALASSLRQNTSLKKLILSFNNIGNEGAKALAEALTVNHTLTHLSFPSNSIWNEGIEAFGDCLPKMKGLEELNVGDLFDTPAADSLLNGLKCNTRLSILYVQLPVCEDYTVDDDEASEGSSQCSCSVSPIEKDIDFFLRCNKSGRSLLQSITPSPSSLWAEVLGKANTNQTPSGVPDVLYHLIRERPDLLCNTR
ncbi:unnamed protein product [Pseudo-nitzschia multistriata]|uniref:Uncharacterized protein n=1 Tax=Pseudo-nitzschia multistriata TaxID=183589 RepID=A0A448YYC9_9STRA|nr:unnamed protein product [Pseudo-nitzschia multistriata]